MGAALYVSKGRTRSMRQPVDHCGSAPAVFTPPKEMKDCITSDSDTTQAVCPSSAGTGAKKDVRFLHFSVRKLKTYRPLAVRPWALPPKMIQKLSTAADAELQSVPSQKTARKQKYDDPHLRASYKVYFLRRIF